MPVEQELDALDRLEGMVQEASVELRKLREENRHLKGMLERRQGEEDEGAGGDSDVGPPESWKKERAALKRRLERLVARLEDLLEE